MKPQSGNLTRDRVQLEAMIADISTGVVTVGPDGTLQYANRAALAMHGVDDLTSLGHTTKAYRERYALQDLQGVPLPPSAFPLDRLLDGDTFDELLVQLPAGSDTVVYKCRGINVRDARGEVDFCALFLEDETERYDAEASAYVAGELRQLTKQAGLSLGDCACLALGMRDSRVVLTADRAW